VRFRQLRSVCIAMVVLAFVATACSSGSGGSGSSPTGGTGTSGSTGSSGSAGGASSATIVAQGLAFHPGTVNVSAGTVTLTVTNKDTVKHTFTLDDGSSTTDLLPGTTTTITLQLSATLGWHCSIHPAMTGTLKVV
jgi:plastocyanin